MKCHGADGTGSPARGLLDEIPDFTSVTWQAQRVDAQLLASILDGKGSGMPPQGGIISEKQALVWWLTFAASLRPGKSPGRGNRQGIYGELL